MNKLKAAEIIQKQRRLWRSQDSDLAIARRDERVYFSLAMMDVAVGISLTLVLDTQFGRVAILVGFLVGACLFLFHSRRFSQIRKLLVDSDAKTETH